MKSRVNWTVALAALAALAIPAVGSANLLVEGGFENNNLAPLASTVSPLTPALWGYEMATNVGLGQSGILPRTGKWMHQMRDEGGTWTQSLQFVNITGSTALQAEAWYNSAAPAATASLILMWFAGPGSWGSPISQDVQNLTLDNSPNTWQQIGYTATVPGGATWVGFQIAFSDPTISPDYAGYVDDASLAPVPEPGSLAALGTGLMAFAGMLMRRRSR